MGKRSVEVVDLTKTAVIIDLTSADTERLWAVKSNIAIPWMSKLPRHDPLKKRCVARRLSVRDQKNANEFRRDATWFDEAELRFNASMPNDK